MNIRDAAKQYLVYQYACHRRGMIYFDHAAVLSHFLEFAGDRPVSTLREGHIHLYMGVALADQSRVELDDTKLRARVVQLFWHWLVANQMVR